MVHKKTKLLEWQVPEFSYREKTPDWYWGVGIVAIVGIVWSAIAGNFLLSFLLLVGVVLIFIYSTKNPETLSVEISEQGIKVGSHLYPYTNLNAFWVQVSETDEPSKLILHTQRWLYPIVVIPISNDVELEDVRNTLLNYLREEELNEPAIDRLSDFLGF